MDRRKSDARNGLKILKQECKQTIEFVTKLMQMSAEHVNNMAKLNKESLQMNSTYVVSVLKFQSESIQKMVEWNIHLEDFLTEHAPADMPHYADITDTTNTSLSLFEYEHVPNGIACSSVSETESTIALKHTESKNDDKRFSLDYFNAMPTSNNDKPLHEKIDLCRSSCDEFYLNPEENKHSENGSSYYDNDGLVDLNRKSNKSISISEKLKRLQIMSLERLNLPVSISDTTNTNLSSFDNVSSCSSVSETESILALTSTECKNDDKKFKSVHESFTNINRSDDKTCEAQKKFISSPGSKSIDDTNIVAKIDLPSYLEDHNNSKKCEMVLREVPSHDFLKNRLEDASSSDDINLVVLSKKIELNIFNSDYINTTSNSIDTDATNTKLDSFVYESVSNGITCSSVPEMESVLALKQTESKNDDKKSKLVHEYDTAGSSESETRNHNSNNKCEMVLEEVPSHDFVENGRYKHSNDAPPSHNVDFVDLGRQEKPNKSVSVSEQLKSLQIMSLEERYLKSLPKSEMPDLRLRPASQFKTPSSNTNSFNLPGLTLQNINKMHGAVTTTNLKVKTHQFPFRSSIDLLGVPKRDSPQIGDICMVGYVQTPSEMFIQVTDINCNDLDVLSMQLFEYFQNSSICYTTKRVAKNKFGNFWICCLDNLAYRVEVIDWLLNENAAEVLVQMIDYGWKHQLHYTALRPLNIDMKKLPQMAQLCHLRNLYPPGSTLDTRKETWPEKVNDSFYEILGNLDETYFMIVYVHYCKHKQSYELDLKKLGAGGEKKTIGQVLINCGLAVEIIDDEIRNIQEDLEEEASTKKTEEVVTQYLIKKENQNSENPSSYDNVNLVNLNRKKTPDESISDSEILNAIMSWKNRHYVIRLPKAESKFQASCVYNNIFDAAVNNKLTLENINKDYGSTNIPKSKVKKENNKILEYNNAVDLQEIPELKAPEVGDIFMIGYVRTPSEIYIEMVDENNDFVHVLSLQLSKLYKNAPVVDTGKTVAMSKSDNYWIYINNNNMYRVEILNWVLDEKTDEILVQLVDYGTYFQTYWVNFSSLRPLHSDLKYFPPRSQLCHLAHLYPPASTKDKMEQRWPAEAIIKFCEVLGNLDCTYFKIVQVDYSEERKSYAIDFIKTDEKDKNTIGQMLLDSGHAVEFIDSRENL